MEFSLYSAHISIYSFLPCLSGIQTDILLPPFICNHILFFMSHSEFGRTTARREVGMRHQQQDPSASVTQHSHGLTSGSPKSIVFPFPVYEYIQSYNTQPHGTKELLINLLKPRISKRL